MALHFIPKTRKHTDRRARGAAMAALDTGRRALPGEEPALDTETGRWTWARRGPHPLPLASTCGTGNDSAAMLATLTRDDS